MNAYPKATLVALCLFLISLIGCTTELINPVPTAKSCSAKSSDAHTTILKGDKIPSIEQLMSDAKFEYAIGEYTSKRYPKPNSVRIDDLEFVNENFATSVLYVIGLKEVGYRPANIHEAIIYATMNPEQQMQAPFVVLEEEAIPKSLGLHANFIRLNKTMNNEHRQIEAQPYINYSFAAGTRYLVHKRWNLEP